MNSGSGNPEIPECGKVLFPLLLVALLSIGGLCDGPTPPPNEIPATVTLTINGVPDEMNDLLVVPPTGFVVKISYQPGDFPIDLDQVYLVICPWTTGCGTVIQPAEMSVGPEGAVWIVPEDFTDFSIGSFDIAAFIRDTAGGRGGNLISFAVRDFPSSPPIGEGQQIWFDFDYEADRDFSDDLEAFGLGSTSDPALSAIIENEVIAGLLETVSAAYHESDPNGVGAADPVAVTFSSTDPVAGLVTRICVGGEDPSGGSTIGNILIDPNNAKPASTECGSIPPTGIFPYELLAYQSDPVFQESFDPLRPSRGGTAVGEHPLDSIVLGASFDPQAASEEELDRYDEIYFAVDRLAAALGTILAHETGHALGLVPPSSPGIGLYGGTSGAQTAHNVTPSGVDPVENNLMNAGSTFTFSKLGGFEGEPVPSFRPLNYAYLRDRALAYVPITELLLPPVLTSVTPSTVSQSFALLVVTGEGFSGTPELRLVNESYTYYVIAENWVSEQSVSGYVVKSQIPSGTYDLEITNSDGQEAVLPDAVIVQ